MVSTLLATSGGSLEPLLPVVIEFRTAGTQQLLTAIAGRPAHGLDHIPVIAAEKCWRHERPVCGELLIYAGISRAEPRSDGQMTAAQASNFTHLTKAVRCFKERLAEADALNRGQLRFDESITSLP